MDDPKRWRHEGAEVVLPLRLALTSRGAKVDELRFEEPSFGVMMDLESYRQRERPTNAAELAWLVCQLAGVDKPDSLRPANLRDMDDAKEIVQLLFGSGPEAEPVAT